MNYLKAVMHGEGLLIIDTRHKEPIESRYFSASNGQFVRYRINKFEMTKWFPRLSDGGGKINTHPEFAKFILALVFPWPDDFDISAVEWLRQ